MYISHIVCQGLHIYGDRIWPDNFVLLGRKKRQLDLDLPFVFLKGKILNAFKQKVCYNNCYLQSSTIKMKDNQIKLQLSPLLSSSDSTTGKKEIVPIAI